MIVEPAGARWYENFTKKENPFAEQAVITAPGIESFREYVLFIQNGIRLLDKDGNLVQTAAADSEEIVDAEDTGEKGYNYHSERFANRHFGGIQESGRYSAAKCMEILQRLSGKPIPVTA